MKYKIVSDKSEKAATYYATHRSQVRTNILRSNLRMAAKLGIDLDMVENDPKEAEKRVAAYIDDADKVRAEAL